MAEKFVLLALAVFVGVFAADVLAVKLELYK